MLKYLALLPALALLLLAFVGPATATGTPQGLTGFAWSPTVGWISFYGSSPLYQVTLDSVSGSLSGYAWSPGVGWIKFDPSFAGADGTSPYGARMDSSGNFSGWARACLFYNNNSCSIDGGKSSLILGGWDGWINFFGTGTFPYGVVADKTVNPWHLKGPTASFDAWGGGNIGWTSFCDQGSTYPYCVSIGALTATCPIIPQDSSGQTIVSSGGTSVIWQATATGGTAPYSYQWGAPQLGTDVPTVSLTPMGSGMSTVNITKTYGAADDGQTKKSTLTVQDSLGAQSICTATTQVVVGTPPPFVLLDTPTSDIISITSQPVGSPAFSSGTTFRNVGNIPVTISIISTNSLVTGGSNLSSPANAAKVKCRLATGLNGPLPSSPTLADFGSCADGSQSISLPADGIAHFNIAVDSPAPIDLNTYSPYKIVVGDSSCVSDCTFVQVPLLFNYAVGTTRPI